MKNIRNHIYLAALLHDIGKFYQRADTGSIKTSKFLTEAGKDERTFCPQYNGVYTHKHVLWTAQFIEDFKLVFDNLLKSDGDVLPQNDSLMHLAAGHHLPATSLSELGKIIKEADCLSSGMDRETDLRDEQDATNWDSFKRKPMVSLLEGICKSNDKITSHFKQPVLSMTLNEDYFPKEEVKNLDYSSLWDKFVGEFKFIQSNTYHAFSETLHSLLFKYTSCIPSSTIHFPDISLYDHLKTTAAIAVCLYDLFESGEKPEQRYLLIGGDLSGIQKYIYTMVSKYAAKNLKGRSFYLRILSDAIVRYLLKELKLYEANVIYNSGGSFYILAPNTINVQNRLNAAVKEIEQKMFRYHATDLFMAIDWVTLSDDALMHRNGEHLGKVWHDLFIKRDKKKHCKYHDIIKDNYSDFFTPILRGGDTQRDIITGQEISANQKAEKYGNLSPLSHSSKEQLQLGEKLRNFDVMVVADEDIPYWKDQKPVIQPIGLGQYYYFLDQKDLNEKRKELQASADKVCVVTLNGTLGNCDFMGRVDGINNIYQLSFYGGNEIFNDKVPTFEQLCETNGEDSMQRIGVLRMDVDNLGTIFQKGISPQRSTLSRYAALSRSFDFFFSGYLNTIWRETVPSQSLILYSGGDDVFIVGRWDVTVSLAEKISHTFRRFTCHNDAFSISGGISIISPSFPIMKAAEFSADAETAAKKHKCLNKEKNAMTILGMPLNWNEEYPIVKELKDNITERLVNGILPKSFCSKVMAHAANANIVEHKVRNFKTFWMMTYDLKRLYNERCKEELINLCIKEVCDNKGKLFDKSIKTNYHPLELWAMACRWAELTYRTNK